MSLQFHDLAPGVSLVEQTKGTTPFSKANGLLIEADGAALVLDVNVERPFFEQLKPRLQAAATPVDVYVSHCHLDHSAHVHLYEEALEARVHVPASERRALLDLEALMQAYGLTGDEIAPYWREFARDHVHYQPCADAAPFTPGTEVQFGDYAIETIPLPGHCTGHHGYLVRPPEGAAVLHVSCLGLDRRFPGDARRFGPWYGFANCELAQYREDIQAVEALHATLDAVVLTSSHGLVYRDLTGAPFAYLRDKIREKEAAIVKAFRGQRTLAIDDLLARDVIFRKRKMESPLREVYRHWEAWILRHQFEDMILHGRAQRVGRDEYTLL